MIPMFVTVELTWFLDEQSMTQQILSLSLSSRPVLPLGLAEVIAMTTLCFTNRCGRLEVPFTELLCRCVRVHKCVLYNYVHVFALFRGSLCLFSSCVSGVVLVLVFAYSERHKRIRACVLVIDGLRGPPQTITDHHALALLYLHFEGCY